MGNRQGIMKPQSRLKENRPLFHQHLRSPYNSTCWSDGDITFTSQGHPAGPWGPHPEQEEPAAGMGWAQHHLPSQQGGGPGRQRAWGHHFGEEQGYCAAAPRDSTKPHCSLSVKQDNPGSLPHGELVVTTHTIKHGAITETFEYLRKHTRLYYRTKTCSFWAFSFQEHYCHMGLGSFGTNSLFCSCDSCSPSCLQSQTLVPDWRNLSHTSWSSTLWLKKVDLTTKALNENIYRG